MAGLAWVAPALFLASALGKTGGEAFRIGYVSGLSFYLTCLYWLLNIPYRWHGIPFAPAAGWLALSGFMALFPAIWVWVLSGNPGGALKSNRGEPSIDAPNGSELLQTVDTLLTSSWVQRSARALGAAALWVGLEMISARLFGGFPWNLLGDSQHHLVPLIQIASVTGVYGISFLIVWLSVALLTAGLMLVRRPNNRAACLGELVVPMLVVAFVFNAGLRQIKNAVPPTRVLNVTLIQPSIPQTVIWDPSSEDARFQRMLNLCEKALTNRTDLLIWPESAIPKLLRYDKTTFEAVTGLARRHHVWMIVGADDAEPKRPRASGKQQADFYNSSFLISPEGRLLDTYRKRSLVIFGEYIPLSRWIPFFKWFTPIEGGFTPGDRSVQFVMDEAGVQTSVLICFEDIFPQLARSDVRRGTDFLVNITNDGWFGHSAAQWQHAFSALPRTVENRRPLIRCTNNGLTCWIDAYGRVRDILRDPSGSVYGPGFVRFEMPLPAANQNLSFYTSHGDLFGWICVLAGAGLLLAGRWRALRRLSHRVSRQRTASSSSGSPPTGV